MKLVGSGKLKSGVDKGDVKKKKKNCETWMWNLECDQFDFWI